MAILRTLFFRGEGLAERERAFYRVLLENSGPEFFTDDGEKAFYKKLAEGAAGITGCFGLGIYIFTEGSGVFLEPKAVWGTFPLLFSPSKEAVAGSSFEAEYTPMPRVGTAFDAALANGRILKIDNLKSLIGAAPEAAKKVGPLSAVPLMAGERLFGLMVFLKRAGAATFSRSETTRLAGLGRIVSEILFRFDRFAGVLERRELGTIHRLSADLQDRLCLKDFPSPEGAAFAGFRVALEGIHSDYLDAVPLRRGGYLIAHGEVTGRAFPAAVTNLILGTILHLLANRFRDPAEALKWLSRGLGRKLEMDLYASLVLFVFDPRTKSIKMAGAGNHGVALFRHRSLTVEEMRTGTEPLGIDARNRYKNIDFRLESGDLLVSYTDGITDAMNSRGESFGLAGVVRYIRENYHLSASQLAASLGEALEKFKEGGPRRDDESLLILKAF